LGVWERFRHLRASKTKMSSENCDEFGHPSKTEAYLQGLLIQNILAWIVRKFHREPRARGYIYLQIAWRQFLTSLSYTFQFFELSLFIDPISHADYCSAVDLRCPGWPAIRGKYFAILPPILPTFVNLPLVKHLPHSMTRLEITNTVSIKLKFTEHHRTMWSC
jgi:hypothetical protein